MRSPVALVEAMDRALRFLEGLGGVYADLLDARNAVVDLIANEDQRTRLVEVMRMERDQARARMDHSIQILERIHMLLYPAPYTNAEGMTFVFHSPMVHEQMQALSDRIRAIPSEISAIEDAP